MTSMNGTPRPTKREFIYTGAISVCINPNRERPNDISQDMDFGTPGFVIERLEGRWPMLRILTVNDRGAPVNGWVIENDVEVGAPLVPRKQ
jgi:hypothetical protein